MTNKIILDTDIGSDIDDAVALAYLLCKPECDLLGITTVSGEPERRAMMASAQCKLAGREVPIYPGAAEPLLIQSRQANAPQADVLNRWPHETRFPKGEAVAFMRKIIRANPGEVTLFPIGPLTNIALLFALDPEIPHLLKDMVLMGGMFDTVNLTNWRGMKWEWNIWCDPHAAAMVFRAPVKRVVALGLDVTNKVYMPAAQVREKFGTTPLLPVRDFAEVWFREREKITFHDPLAAVSIFKPNVCGYVRGDIEVELHNPERFGVTEWSPDNAGRHEIATTVSPESFFEEFFTVTR